MALHSATRLQSFLEEVASIPGCERVYECIQCGMCSGSCPAAPLMEYSPRKVIAMARAGMRGEILSSSSTWHCYSCYLCTSRCPRNVKPAEIMHALDTLAIREGFKVRETTTPTMYRSFVDSIKANGRVHEFGFMFKYYLGTNPFAALKMLPLGMKLFTHGRMPLRAKKTKGRKELEAMLKKARSSGGAR